MGDWSMARLNIALLVGDIRDAYSSSVARGAVCAAQDNDCNLLIVPGRYFKVTEDLLLGEYEYQYQTLFRYFKDNNVDLIVLAAGGVGFVSGVRGRNSLEAFREQIGDIPLYTISGDCKDVPNVRYDNTAGIIESVEYLIKKQNCKKIVMVGGPQDNVDTIERVDAYRKAMNDNGLESLVIYGDFTERSRETIYNFLKKNKDTEAIVFANDRMAISGYDAAGRLGLKVGEDIAFVGFDNVDKDVYMIPALASVYADAVALGRTAVTEALEFLKTGVVKDKILPSRLILRSSIMRSGGQRIESSEFGYGFDEASDIETMIEDSFSYVFDHSESNERRSLLFSAYKEFINAFTNVHRTTDATDDDFIHLEKAFDRFLNADTLWELDLDRFLVIFESMEKMMSAGATDTEKRSQILGLTSHAYRRLLSAIALRNIDLTYKRKKVQHEVYRISSDLVGFESISNSTYASLFSNFDRFGIKNCYLFLFEDPIKNEFGDDFVPDRELFLKAVMRNGKLSASLKSNRRVLLNNLFSYVFEKVSGRMIMLNIYIRNMIYGVVICDIPYEIFNLYESFNYQISSAVRTIRLLEENAENKMRLNESLELLTRNNIRLETISKSDELTGVLNRRGFMIRGKAMLKEPKSTPKYIFVGYADVDGLKKVNDTYGHDEGDILIKTAADILKSTIGERGIVGRIGGDEFATLMYVDDEGMKHKIEQSLNNAITKYNKTSGKPYYFSLSFGIFTFPYTKDLSLQDLLESADKKMYEIKAKHRKNRKK